MTEPRPTHWLRRPFEAPLSQEKITYYKMAAFQLSQELRKMPDWKDKLNHAYLFGSLADGSAKSGSDVDLALELKGVLASDLTFYRGILAQNIEDVLTKMQMEDVPVKVQIVLTEWMNDQTNLSPHNKAVIQSILTNKNVIF